MTSTPPRRSVAPCGWRLLSAVALGLILHLAAFAAEPVKKNFDVPADDAARALKRFAAQSGEQLLYSASDVADVKTFAVKGELTAREALAKMLEGTPLVIAQDKSTGALAVRKETPAESKNVPSRRAEREADGAAGASIRDGIIKLDRFEVMGSKLLNMDIPRSRDDAQPYVIFNRSTIANSGATSLDDFFRQRLPQNSALTSNSQTASPTGASSSINLRGLGPNQTLILVDGRRLSATRFSSNISQPDINGIPLSAVERIEVLPTTASGIYGGSATGGVINIVLRRDYAGLEITTTYDNTFDTDSAIKRLDVNAGFTLEGGKTNVLIAGSWTTTNALLIQDRGFQTEGIKRVLANNPNFFTDVNLFVPNTTNISSADGRPLVLKPQFGGKALNSPFTYVPYGYAGPNSDNGAALAANAGKFNYDPADNAFFGGKRSALTAAPERKSIMLTVRRQFTPLLQLFGEFSFDESRTDFPSLLEGSIFTLPEDVPTNPFTGPVNVATRLTNNSTSFNPVSRRSRLAGGAIFKLPAEWNATLDYSYDRSATSLSNSQVVPTGAQDELFNSGVFDPFRDVSRYPIDLTPLVQNRSWGSAQRASAFTAAARASGPVGSLPAGRPTLSVLVEHRGDRLPANSIAGSSFFTLYVGDRSQYTDSAYLEAEVPFVSPEMNLPFVQNLSLQLAGRTDRYEINGSSSSTSPGAVTFATTRFTSQDPTAGLRWVVNPSLLLRASYGTGFLPPSVEQLTSTNLGAIRPGARVFDLKRGNTPVVGVPAFSGGNQSLKPEQSTTWSAGAVLTPQFLPGLRLSVDWSRIEKRDNISSLGAIQNYVRYEDYLPAGAVVRAAPIPGDGYSVGPITRINALVLNLARAEVESYDIQADYTRTLGSAGKLEFYATATRTTHYKTQLVSALPVLENIGYATEVDASDVGFFPAFPLKWRGNAGLTWSRGPWSVGWTSRYYSSVYLDPRNTINNARIIAGQGNNGRIASQLYHDFFATYRFGTGSTGNSLGERASRWLSRTEVQVGVRNVFNTWPPFDATDTSRFYFSVGDPRLASYYVSVKKAF